MLTNHLNDDLIQEYLDGSMAMDQKMRIQQHLDTCEECRDMLASYQDIFEILESDIEFELPKNFTRKVLRQTHKHAVGSLQFGLMHIFFGLAAIIVLINVVPNYAHVDTFVATANATWDAFKNLIPPISNISKSLMSKIQFDGINIVLAAFGLLGLFLIDRFVLKPRFKAMS